MTDRRLAIIGAALDLGAGRRGVDMGPSAIRYAGIDDRVNATVPPFEAALKAAGKTYTVHVYDGVNHAFHNDTAGARYDAAAAKLAWSRTIEFFDRTLR